ncbi:unnamed protein product [Phyllotreta striolata]|uniref:Uncharacterized protein n=1 Tax=Phyllotreta striolata TaxID=444603 RepID=A0A9N9TQ75_PHYSR|nr:unnamed protein product [Phyllotreta striolata]
MDDPWTGLRRIHLTKFFLIFCCVRLVNTCELPSPSKDDGYLDAELKQYVDSVFSVNELSIVPGVRLEEIQQQGKTNGTFDARCQNGRSLESVEEYVDRKIDQFAEGHALSVNLPETARFLFSSGELSKDESGKSSFLTGFGMGFLALGLKKLLLPFVIGAQLIKSVIIAMFLPSILGGLGKIVGKGLSTFSGISGASTGFNNQQTQLEDFEFKDVDPYNNEGDGMGHHFNEEASNTNNQLAALDAKRNDGTTDSRTSPNQRVSFATPHSDNYYLRRPEKKTNYKVFHKIPSSSLLLTSYDPFYSPLLSRLDAIFQQLGLGNAKSPETERCRERLVCMMYANPTKYAPYSNLVSAQLSRELNELRKPSNDNPDILRFFRYMKAAKDGQDGVKCERHGKCPSLTTNKPSPAMITTFNDINKLVSARKLQ